MNGAGCAITRFTIPARTSVNRAAISGPSDTLLREKECADPRGVKRFALGTITANRAVLRKHDPTALTDLNQPICIGCLLRKVVVVNLNMRSGFAQGLSNKASAQAAVNEEDDSTRRFARHAASGSSPRTISSISARERP